MTFTHHHSPQEWGERDENSMRYLFSFTFFFFRNPNLKVAITQCGRHVASIRLDFH